MSALQSMDGWVGFAGLVVLQATFLLTAAWLGARILRRRPAAERHLVWTVAVAGVVALPFLGSVLPAWHVPVPVPAWTMGGEVEPGSSAAAARPVPIAPAPTASRAVGTDAGEHEAAAPPGPELAVRVSTPSGTGPHRAGDGAVAGATPGGSAGRLAARIWLAGLLVMGVIVLLGQVHVRVMARRADSLGDPGLVDRAARIAGELGVKRPVRLLEGGDEAMPMTFGLLHATLLLPSSARTWSPARQEAVLRHELAHIRRHDSLTQLVADAGCALYWFHPLMWLAARQLRVEREHACDDVVLVSGARASEYAKELLEIARTMRSPRRVARVGIAMAQPTRLRSRILALLEDRRRAGHLSDRLLVPSWIGALGLIVVVAAIAPAPVPALASVPVSASLSASLWTSQPGATPAAISQPAAPASSDVRPDALAGASGGTGIAEPELSSGEFPRALQTVSAADEPDCWENSQGYHYVRSVEIAGERSRQYLSQHSLGDLQVCVQAVGWTPFEDEGPPLERMNEGDRLVLASRTSTGRQTLEILRTGTGFEHTWFVDGTRTPFDDTARQWRDTMLEVAAGYDAIGRIRGEEGRLRGEIGRIRGEDGRLLGEIGRIRGEEGQLMGEIGRIRGEEGRLRGEVGILSGSIASLENARRATQDAQTRDRLAVEITEARTQLQQAERRLEESDASRRIAEVEGRIRTDTAERIREIERQISARESEPRIREIEGRIEAVDADRRIGQIRDRLEEHERRLQEIQARLR